MLKNRLFLTLVVIILIISLSSFILLVGCRRALRRQAIKNQLEEQREEQAEETEKEVLESGSTAEESTGTGGKEEPEVTVKDESEGDTSSSIEETIETEESQNTEAISEEDTAQTSAEETSEETTTVEETEDSDIVIFEAEEITAEIPIVVSESGSIGKGSPPPSSGSHVSVGDSYLNIPIKGFVSFNITSLHNAEVQSAKISLKTNQKLGNFFELKESLCIKVISWGIRPIEMNDFDKSGAEIGCYNAPNIGKSPETLKNELQKAIDDGKKRFQICLYGKGPSSDNDDENDAFLYVISETGGDIVITVTYTMQ